MNLSEIETQVQVIVNKALPPKLREAGQWEDKTLPQLEIDSLAFADITFNLEDAFKVEIPLENLDPALQSLPARQVCRALAEAIQGLLQPVNA
jgi:acyl carrier protein